MIHATGSSEGLSGRLSGELSTAIQGRDTLIELPRSPTFTADLAFISLLDLLQLMDGIRATGVIVLRCGQDCGLIQLHEGAIVDARISADSEDDAVAETICQMLQWPDGEFLFDPDCWEPDQQAERLTVGQVLMEGLG